MNEKLVPEFSSLGKFISISLVFFSMPCCGDFALDAPHTSDPSLNVCSSPQYLFYLNFKHTKRQKKQCQEVVYITNKAQVEIYNQQGPQPNG
jgi:hypothetical protein